MDESPPDTRYRRPFDAAIADALQQALRIIRADPSLLFAGTSLLWHQNQAAATRAEKALDEGYTALGVTGEMSWALRGTIRRND